MNEYDSELVKSILTGAGYSFTDDEKEAGIILLNTCSVRENAHRKVYGQLDTFRKEFGKNKIIGVLGCMATALKDKLLGNKNIDFTAGPDSYKKLPQIISENIEFKNKTSEIDLSALETYSDILPSRDNGVNAHIAIMRGCDNFCSFCIVPFARGRERSRSLESISKEANKCAIEGFKQITLLGQNVNSYCYSVIARSETTKQSLLGIDCHAPKSRARNDENMKNAPRNDNARNDVESYDFCDIISALSKIDAIKRIRFMSPHPKDFPDKLITEIKNNPKLCKHVHLPLQSGNDRILKLMNRKYTQSQFLKLVDKLRKATPNLALTTDVIIGFPTETKDEFNDTYKVMKEIEFDSAFIFKYSPREGTLAAKKYEDNVKETDKTERIVKLNEMQKKISLKKNKALIGQTLQVLIEAEETAKSKNDIQGRADNNKLVIIPKGKHQVGDFVNVNITDATANILKGEVA